MLMGNYGDTAFNYSAWAALVHRAFERDEFAEASPS
jgi:hypothetical protein